jgi:O-antigen/teichoic acid export membrane protein
MTGASRAAAAAAAAATGVFVARLLGPGGAGKYAIAQTLTALLTVASTLGVEHGIAYYVSSGRWRTREAHRSAQRVALVSGLVGAGLGILARIAIPSAFGGLSLASTTIAAFALPFALSWYYATFVALAVEDYETFVLPPALQASLMLGLVVVLGAVYGLAGAVVGLALSHALTAAATMFFSRRMLASGGAARPAEPGTLRRAIKFGVKGYAANALQFINYRLDLFILASVAASADVGHYAVAVAATGVMWLLPQAISEVLFPRVAALSASEASDSDSMRALAEAKSLRHTTLIVMVTTAVLALAIVFLIVPVYGAAFHPAIALALILLPGVAVLGLASPMAATIVGRGHPGYSLVITLIVTPLTIVLYVLLIPGLHATGAALGSSISYALSFVLVVAFYARVTGAPVLRNMVPTRAELEDYRILGARIGERLRGRAGSRRSA